ncbi:helix-turn-helix domain-containing protein [Streptomyces xiamenensis]|uniref:TetR/AcrR family transcriptional regulator n=1 Tax=Streptomyces xiamenensis TaxID=408015 RepID=UPI00343643B2
MSAEERRTAVIRAAVVEFARGGYAGTTTAAIARRVGVSQPYLFRLFPDKRAIFLAAAEHGTAEIRRTFERVSEGLDPWAAHDAMAQAYTGLTADRDKLMFQMQMYVAVHTAEAGGDEDFAARIRAYWNELFEAVHLRLGADGVETADFLANGMLINVMLALGFPADHPLWVACAHDHEGKKRFG